MIIIINDRNKNYSLIMVMKNMSYSNNIIPNLLIVLFNVLRILQHT